MKSGKIITLLSMIVTVFISSCSSGRKADSQQHPFVAAYTTGNISVRTPIIVKFTDDIEFTSAPQAGDEADKKLFSITPSVSGKAVWKDDKTVEFRHDEPFESDREYTVTVNVNRLANTSGVPKTFTFKVSTVKTTYSYFTQGLSVYNDLTPNIYYLKGTVNTSDFTESRDAEKILKISPDKFATTWTHNESGTSHEFTIDSLRAGNVPYDLKLSFDGKPIGQDYNSEEVVTVPEAGVFSLMDVSVEYAPEFVVAATFSAPLEEKQRMGNYISLSDGSQMRFVVVLNKVYIYPSARMTGEYTINFNRGIRSRDGQTLEENETRTVFFDDIEPAVKFLGKGVILPSDNNMKIPFRAVNFAEVEVKVVRIFENNIIQFMQENTLDGMYDLYKLSKEVARTTITLGEKDSDKLRNWNTYSLDLSKLISTEPGAIYRVMLRGAEPLVADYEEGYVSDYYFGPYSTYQDRIRNILASDLGMIAKGDDNGNMSVYVTNLVTAMPEPGVSVRAYDFTNQLLKEGITDNSGKVNFEKMKDEPHTLVAYKGNHKGYLKVASGYNLSMSSFDVSGSAAEKGLKGFIYGERGVWRPGDPIFLTFILQDKNGNLPKNHPVSLEFVNPMGQITATQTKTVAENGMYAFELATDADAPTGNWEVKITVGGEIFTKRIKVETVKPNRLKIDFKLNDTPFLKADKITGTLASNWLHGAKAPNLEAKVDIKLAKTKSAFPGYEKYVFDDNTKQFETEEQELFSGKTDANGNLTFTKKIEGLDNAPGLLRAMFTVRLYEPGGDFSIDQYSTLLAPYKRFIGLKTPAGTGNREMLETDKTHKFEIITLNDEGKPLNSSGRLRADIYKMEWSWWWNSSDDNLAAYSQNSYRTPVYTADISLSGGKGEFSYKWGYYDWGLYLVRVYDPEGGHSVSSVCYVDWGGYNRSLDGDGSGATMLTFSADREKYGTGETAQFTIPSSKGARALVSLESGSKILDSFWVNCEQGQTTFEVKTTPEMAPNVYVHVTLIQPHAQTDNDAPMRLYGVVPLFVEDAKTILNPVVSIPEVIKPESEFTVKVSEENGEPMSYTLAIVDDGLLDLTRFKTPDPWSYFFAREALGIRTWDLYDLVIGAYGGKIEQLFAIGGDDEALNNSNAKAQRFKPVVKFLGPFTLAKGRTAEHKITLPPYVGSVRTMVVATNGQAFGAAEKTSQVRKPLMISTTLPRVIGTEEEFLLPVTVFAMEDNVRNVTVTLSQHEMFDVSGGTKQSVTFTETGDKIVYFRLKAKSAEGIGKISVTASTTGDSAAESLEIDVRDPNPRVSTSLVEIVEPGKTYKASFALAGISGTNEAVLEISSLPPLNLGERLKYLLNYPHGCIEQTTSAAFPQIYLRTVANTDNATNARSEGNVKAALTRLTRFQIPEGGFSYWPGERMANAWGTTYAGHFMLEAEKAGYALPSGMKDKWLAYEQNTARSWTPASGYTTDQAYRLYVLALSKNAERGAMNRLLEQTSLTQQDKWLLAGAYAFDGRADIARSIISGITGNAEEYSPFNPYFASPERDLAVNLTVMTALKNKREAFALVVKLSESLSSRKWLSTQSTAWALMAVSQYVEQTGENQQMNFQYSAGSNKGSEKSIKAVWETSLDVKDKSGNIAVELTNNGDNTIYLKLSSSGVAAKGAETAASNNLKIGVSYTDLGGKAIDVRKISQGTDFEAHVTVTNPGVLGSYTNMVLSQVFPSGWEIRNDRLNFDETGENSGIRYQDIRDDRVYSYFDLRSGASKTVTVQLTATYRGRFYLPAVVCDAMYDNSINASTSGMWVEVTE